MGWEKRGAGDQPPRWPPFASSPGGVYLWLVTFTVLGAVLFSLWRRVLGMAGFLWSAPLIYLLLFLFTYSWVLLIVYLCSWVWLTVYLWGCLTHDLGQSSLTWVVLILLVLLGLVAASIGLYATCVW